MKKQKPIFDKDADDKYMTTKEKKAIEKRVKDKAKKGK